MNWKGKLFHVTIQLSIYLCLVFYVHIVAAIAFYYLYDLLDINLDERRSSFLPFNKDWEDRRMK